MVRRLLLLTGPVEAKFLLPHLAGRDSQCAVVHAASLDSLAHLIEQAPFDTRLLAFCTAVIVPAHLLSRLPGPSYNIHPGPPSFPGRHPESWGAYHGVSRFGATLHEMARRVDEGAIVDVEWTDLPAGAGQMEVGLRAFTAGFRLLLRWSEDLVSKAEPLPLSEHRWSGHKTTHAELEAMCRITADIDAAEFERRRRSFAEQPGGRMTLSLFGAEFVYTAPRAKEDEPDVADGPPGPAPTAS